MKMSEKEQPKDASEENTENKGIPVNASTTTVFVGNLPFDVNDSQLEQVFSEVGPIKRAFIVKDRDNRSKSRGCGYVQFVLPEDAEKCTKLEKTMGGRKIRLSIAARKPKHTKRKAMQAAAAAEAAGEAGEEIENEQEKEIGSEKGNVPAKKAKLSNDENAKDSSRNFSSKSDLDRTIVLTGLTSKVKRKAFRLLCEEFGEIENIVYPVPERDDVTAFIRYKEYKSAVRATQKVSGKKVKKSRILSACLLTKENKHPSKKKLQQSRLIIRNLSFKCEEEHLRGYFGAYGKLMEINIPTKKVNGKEVKKGYAFIQFSDVGNAKTAVSEMNLKEIMGRQVVVDWAISKDEYVKKKAEEESMANKEEKGKKEVKIKEEKIKKETGKEVKIKEEKRKKETGEEVNIKEKKGKEMKGKEMKGKEVKGKEVKGKEVKGKEVKGKEVKGKEVKIKEVKIKKEKGNEKKGKEPKKQKEKDKEIKNPGDVKDNNTIVDDDESEQEDMSECDDASDDASDCDVKGKMGIDEEKVDDGGEVEEDDDDEDDDEEEEDDEEEDDDEEGDEKDEEVANEDNAEEEDSDDGGNDDADDDDGDVDMEEDDEDDVMDEDEDDADDECDEEKTVKPKRQFKDAKEGKTIFLRNLSYNVDEEMLKEEFEKYGEIDYCKCVYDEKTGRNKGTAFLKFKEKKSTDDSLSEFEKKSKDGVNTVIDGRPIFISLAVTQGKLNNIQQEKSDSKKETDKRNLYLATEGIITRNSPAAEGLPEAELKKREKALAEKKAKLKNPQYFVSRTRLCVRNLPLTTDVDELVGAFRKHLPDQLKIGKVKIMRSKDRRDLNGKLRSLGFGFIEMDAHENALSLLRAINNNPDVFGEKRRPIVEFSVENSKALKILELKKNKIETKMKNQTEANEDEPTPELDETVKKIANAKRKKAFNKRVARYKKKKEAKKLQKNDSVKENSKESQKVKTDNLQVVTKKDTRVTVKGKSKNTNNVDRGFKSSLPIKNATTNQRNLGKKKSDKEEKKFSSMVEDYKRKISGNSNPTKKGKDGRWFE